MLLALLDIVSADHWWNTMLTVVLRTQYSSSRDQLSSGYFQAKIWCKYDRKKGKLVNGFAFRWVSRKIKFKFTATLYYACRKVTKWWEDSWIVSYCWAKGNWIVASLVCKYVILANEWIEACDIDNALFKKRQGKAQNCFTKLQTLIIIPYTGEMQTKYPKILKSEWSAFVASNSGKLDNFSKRKTKPLTFKQVKIELKQYVRGLISLSKDHKDSVV